ncbi:MAG: prolipoprotein diacylglyceryl transferase [Candidatus Hydrogenedentes bacterium]|nr:prolipoprotein diacylglyceryl transferase [Candidatus Hydrogenedentota bacterium]
MYSYLQIGQRAVSSYHACLILAFVVGALLLARTPPEGFSSDKLHIQFSVIIPVFLLALFGAKFFSLVLDEGSWSFRNFLLWRGGYYYHGGLVGGVLGYVLYLRWTGSRIFDGLDWMSPFAALGEAIARVGCFLAGCCYGKTSGVLTAVVYPAHSPVWSKQVTSGLLDHSASASLPVHPAPLYTSFAMIALFLFLRILQ